MVFAGGVGTRSGRGEYQVSKREARGAGRRAGHYFSVGGPSGASTKSLLYVRIACSCTTIFLSRVFYNQECRKPFKCQQHKPCQT